MSEEHGLEIGHQSISGGRVCKPKVKRAVLWAADAPATNLHLTLQLPTACVAHQGAHVCNVVLGQHAVAGRALPAGLGGRMLLLHPAWSLLVAKEDQEHEERGILVTKHHRIGWFMANKA